MSSGVSAAPRSDEEQLAPTPRRPLRVLHVISGLGVGGAEAMLRKLVQHSLTCGDASDLAHSVVSVSDLGPIGSELRSLGVRVEALDLRGSAVSGVRGALRQIHALRSGAADVVHGWMYHGNLVASILAHRTRIPVAWNIRASGLGVGERRSTRAVMLVGARVARRAKPAIVANSVNARETHVALGYPRDRFTVIPNGFDVSHFRRDAAARAELRDALRIPREAFVVGMIARAHRVKGHDVFVRAAMALLERQPRAFFLLAGDGTDTDAGVLRHIAEAGIGSRIRLLGRRNDMSRLYSALDICSLTSTGGESFPNVLGEAMSCEVPCIATAVGGCVELVGDTGELVPPGDAVALMEAWWRWSMRPLEDRQRVGVRARQRIEQSFSLERVALMYRDFYRQLVRQRHAS